MPTVPTLESLFQFVANMGTILAIVAVAVWRFQAWQKGGQKGSSVLVTERSCQLKHEAVEARLDSIEAKLSVLIKELAEFFGELREMQGRQEERDAQAGVRKPRKSRT